MKYTCPVCGYADLEEPAKDHMICPSCGTQFGYTDVNKSHSDLRNLWLDKGAKWHSKVDLQPINWNPIEQLKIANLY